MNGTQLSKEARPETCALGRQRQEQVLAPHVCAVTALRLPAAELQHLLEAQRLRPRASRSFAQALAQELFDGRASSGKIGSNRGQKASGQPALSADQAEQEMFCPREPIRWPFFIRLSAQTGRPPTIVADTRPSFTTVTSQR